MFDISSVFTHLKKHFTWRDILITALLGATYCISRLYHIHLLPIFNDEGIYIRWAKVAWHDASWRFISLTDGKQPLQTWGTIPFLKLFPNDALLAGRLFSVATGLFGLMGLILLLWYVFDKRTAYIGALLYIFSPYFLFYDRMAMVDSGVNAFFIWILLFSIILVRTVRLDVALVFGIIAGFGLLAKSSVQMFVGMSFVTSLALFDYKKRKLSGLVSYIMLFGLAFGMSQLIYNIQRLSPFMHYIAEKNTTFVMTFGEWLHNPFAVFFSNLTTVPYYVFSESGWVVVPFALVGLYLLLRKNMRLFWYFALWIAIPYGGIAALTRVLFPRYIIFFGTLLTILTAYTLGKIENTKIRAALLSMTLAVLMIFQYPMWTNYTHIIFPPTDRGQYIDGVTVGVGVKEIMDYARTKSAEKPVIIMAEGNFGLVGDLLDTYLHPSDTNIRIEGYWPLNKSDLLARQKDLTSSYVFVVTAHQVAIPADWPVRLIHSYYKTSHTSVIHLLELTR